jgi:spore coat polysaccharide biosynthesis protein SpsF
MSIVGIIQARNSSERLRSKILKKISGKPMLFHIIERLKRSEMIDRLILATSTRPEDEILRDFTDDMGIGFYAGSLHDVLDRFVQAGKESDADSIVRICGDNPLIDPLFIDMMIQSHLREEADFTHCPSIIPLGTGAEVVSFQSLEKINRKKLENRYREHVTTYFLAFKENFKTCSVPPPFYLKGKDFRLTVDTKDDLKLMRRIYEEFYRENEIVDLIKVIDYLEKNRSLLAVNQHVVQKDWRKTA